MNRRIQGDFTIVQAFLGLALVALIGVPIRTAGAEFWVAPMGSDNANGSREHPFATLARARDAARTVSASQARSILVRGGNYYNVRLTLGPQDSGLTVEAAPGERPVLHGGQPIRGWQKDGDHFYAAALPAFPVLPDRAASDGWQIRALQVNGQWRPRARFPEHGELPHLTSFNVRWMSTTGGGWERKPTRDELTTLKYRAGDLPAGLEITNAEITVFHKWDESCVGVAHHDVTNHVLRLTPPTGHPPGAFGVKKFVVRNTREGLQRPGQWYHDRARQRLVYWPLPGEDMSQIEVIAPSATTIIRLRGTPDARVKGVTLRGLALAVTSVPLISGDFAARRFDGAVSLSNTENCTLSGLTIRCVAGHAVKAERGDIGTLVTDCEVTQCGAGGIYVGGTSSVISNNLVQSVGLSYPSAVGLQGGGKGLLISHNEIHDCPYSGICYGASGSVFEDNLIYDCMKVLGDGAAIYLSGAKDTVLRRNVARDITDISPGYGASAYYLDEQCTGCLVEGNLALRVAQPSHNHMATNNVIRNNVFIVSGDTRLTFPRCDSFSFERNIIHASGKIRIEGANAMTNWSKNLFFSGTGAVEQVQLDRYRATGTSTNLPRDTIMADPRFRNWQAGDFRFELDSPALRLGIQPLDVSNAGRARKVER